MKKYDGRLPARVFEANLLLASRVRAASVPGACDEIARLLGVHRKYGLFREFFPAAWACSLTSFQLSSASFGGIPERVAEFYEIVNRELFPILDEWNEDPDFAPEEFSVRPLNIDFCCEEFDYADLRTSFVAALMLFGAEDEEAAACLGERTGIDGPSLPKINVFPHEDTWSGKPEGRAVLYRNILEFVDHSTGNPWLDSTWCQPPIPIDWTPDAVRYLAESYREAAKRIEAIDKLDRLIERDPKRILGEMISYWNTGHQRVPSNSEASP